MTTTLSLTNTIIERLEMGKSEVHIGANDPNTWLNRVFTNENDVLTIDTFDVSLRSVYQNVLFFNS
jgi:hypothetical protein